MLNWPIARVLTCLASFLVAVEAVADIRIDLVGHWGGSVHAVDMGGSYAYVGVGPRLVVVDLSNPAVPARIGQTPPLGHIPTAITLSQSRCYVGLITGTLCIVDVGDPAQPRPVGSLQLGDRVVDIAVQDDIAIASTEDAGIYVLDVVSPAHPTVLYNLNNPYYQGATQRR
jgi:hypothetical protein